MMMPRTSSLLGLAVAAGLMLMAATIVAAEGEVTLSAAVESGVPEGFTEDQWLDAQATASLVETSSGTDTVELETRGLVPNGVYTIWWVGQGTDDSAMGPGGGAAANEFTADASGNAETTLTVPSGSGYQKMVVAYHADGQTHGETPGEMGKQTFVHLAGPWPGAE